MADLASRTTTAGAMAASGAETTNTTAMDETNTIAMVVTSTVATTATTVNGTTTTASNKMQRMYMAMIQQMLQRQRQGQWGNYDRNDQWGRDPYGRAPVREETNTVSDPYGRDQYPRPTQSL